MDLTSGPKTLLSELKRVIEENDSRNTNIKSFASLFHDNEIFPFRLENKYRNKDIWQLIIVPKDCERGKQTQIIISVNGNYNELQVHQIGLFLTASDVYRFINRLPMSERTMLLRTECLLLKWRWPEGLRMESMHVKEAPKAPARR